MADLVGVTIVGASLGAGIGSLGLVWYLTRYRGRPGANWFIASLTAQAIWSLSYGVGLTVGELQLRAATEALAWIGMNAVGPLFFAFALEYTGRATLTERRWLPVLLLSPVVTALLASGLPANGLLWRGFQFAPVFDLATVEYAIQPLGYLTVMASLTMAGAGVLLLVETVLSYGSLYRREAVAVVLSPIPATVPLLVWLGQIGPFPALNLTPALLLTHVTLDAYAFTGTPMFESNPVTLRAAEQSAVDDLEDPLLVMDTTNRVVKCNERAQTLFDVSPDRLPVPLEALVDDDLATLRADGELSVDGRIYSVSWTPLTDADGDDVGEILVLYDITTERDQQQQLSVLNRVLRHNLRNEMSVIRGNAEVIQSQWDDPQLSTQAASIADASDRLLSIAAKLREFEQAQEGQTRREGIELPAVLEATCESVRGDHPDATIRLTADRTLPAVRTDPEILSLAVGNLLDNAIRHSEVPNPAIELTVERGSDGESVLFEVRDSNSPIPDIEIEAIDAAEEQALMHGSGIGLWIVYWSVRSLGGTLAFGYDEGNVVTIDLPIDP